jgi:hypothetical protein
MADVPEWARQDLGPSAALVAVCDTIAAALKSDAIPDALTEMTCVAEYYRSLQTMGRSGLRISSIGKHPLLNALGLIGLETSTPSTEEWITRAGHSYEWWVKAKLVGAQKAGYIPTDWVIDPQPKTVYWGDASGRGITGNPDLVVIAPQGTDRPLSVTFDCKHVSQQYLGAVLEPRVVNNPKTGLPNKIQGQFEPVFNPSALANDYRGYVTQSAIYGRCGHGAGALIAFDKQGNTTYIIPIPGMLQETAIASAKGKVAELRRFEDQVIGLGFEESVSLALAMFHAPGLVPQKSRHKPTGFYYLPQIFKYAPPETTDLIYDQNPYWDGEDPRIKYAPIGAPSPEEIAGDAPVVWSLAQA